MINIEEDLRPAEILWLRERESEKSFDVEYVQAVLGDLALRGLIDVVDAEEFRFERTGEVPEMELRSYERDVIEGIEMDSLEGIARSVYEFDFESFFVDLGVLEVVTVDGEEQVVESEQYETYIDVLDSIESRVRGSFESGNTGIHERRMEFAFPDLDWTDTLAFGGE